MCDPQFACGVVAAANGLSDSPGKHKDSFIVCAALMSGNHAALKDQQSRQSRRYI